MRAPPERTDTMTTMTVHDPTVPVSRVSFRRLVDEDLPLLYRWLNEAGVVRWWEGDDVSWDAVVHDYGSASSDPTEHWIASVDGRDIGWIQCYAAADKPEERAPWWDLGVDRRAARIDYLIGESADRGPWPGLQDDRQLRRRRAIARHPDGTQAAAAPHAANVASGWALEMASFRFVGTIEDRDGPCPLLVTDRNSVMPPTKHGRPESQARCQP